MTFDLSAHLKSVAVAFGDCKSGEYAMKWAVEHLHVDCEDHCPSLIFIHVFPRRLKVVNRNTNFYPDPRWSSPVIWDVPDDNGTDFSTRRLL